MRHAKTYPKPSIDEWASQILLHAHAIESCPGCGFRRLKYSHRSIDYAHALAEHAPYPGISKAKSLKAVDDLLDSLSDECPGC